MIPCKLLGSLCCFLILFNHFSEQSEIHLDGSSYIKYDLLGTKTSIYATTDTLSLRFKTIQATGLLFYIHGMWQYISLELVQGKLRYTINLGNYDDKPLIYTFGDKLCDNSWHSVHIIRDRQKLYISLDKEQAKTVEILSKQPRYQTYIYLTLDIRYYVGGTWKTKNEFGLGLVKNFIGCLGDVLFNAFHPISDVERNRSSTGYEVTGNIAFTCPFTDYTPITFTNNMGGMEIPTPSKHELFVSLAFRTYDRNGILMYRDGYKVSAYLYLEDANLKFEFVAGFWPLVLSTESFAGGSVNDGEWHTALVTVDAHFMTVEIDGLLPVNTSAHQAYLQQSSLTRVNFDNVTYVGGATYYRKMHGFVGCMRDVVVNGEKIDLEGLIKPPGIRSLYVVKGQCTLTSHCHPSPCLYRSRCVQALNNFTCKCQKFYDGRFCQTPLFQATCQGYKELGMKKDAYCVVDPDNAGQLPEFRVLCNMTAAGDAVTIVNHTKSNRSIRIDKEAKRFSTSRQMYLHLLDYGVNLNNLRNLVDESARCRQYVQFDCINTTFLDPPYEGGFGGRWFTTTGTEMYYWGGTWGNTCACGRTRSCHNRKKRCNCDTGDNVWRQDAGYITNRADLPLYGVYFPKTAKASTFTVGPLECFGRKPKLTRGTNARKYFALACQPLVTTPPPVIVYENGQWVLFTGTTVKPSTESPSTKTLLRSTRSTAHPPATTNSSSVSTPRTKTDHGTQNGAVGLIEDGTTGNGTEGGTEEVKRSSTVPDDVSKAPNTSFSSAGHDGFLPADPTRHIRVDVSSQTERSKSKDNWLLIAIIAGSSVFFVFAVAFLVLVVRHKRKSGFWFTGLFLHLSCRKHQQLPKIEIYRHSMGTDSPDILHMEDFKNTKVVDLKIHPGRFVPKKNAPKKTVAFSDQC